MLMIILACMMWGLTIVFAYRAYVLCIKRKPEPTLKEFDFDNAPPRLAYSWKDEAESMKLSIRKGQYTAIRTEHLFIETDDPYVFTRVKP